MKINKTILLTCLLVSGLANSQEFYTCVPKKDWWDSMIKSNTITQSDIKKIVKEQHVKRWNEIIHLTPHSAQREFKQVLPAGKYRVIAAAGGGEKHVKEFSINTHREFKACVGEAGKDGVNGGHTSSSGGQGFKGGGGMGYDGRYEGGTIIKSGDFCSRSGEGYGPGFAGQDLNADGASVEKDVYCNSVQDQQNGGAGGRGGTGCYGGASGGFGHGGGGSGGGGSYFKIAGISPLILKGGDGVRGGNGVGGKGAKPDGYVIIERWE